MTRVYLVRHGEVIWNKKNTYAGQTDLPLNETGLAQAELLADYLKDKGIAAVYSSDLSRARETASAIARPLGLDVRTDKDLREVNYGEWEGLSEAEIAEQYPEIFSRWRDDAANTRIPGGESFNEMKDRAYPSFMKIALSHPEQDIAVVAHKSVNRTLLCCLLGADINIYRRVAQENACVNVIQVRRPDWLIIESINERCFLTSKR
ncbi:MAG TPA: histidine phosphatase family protein [Armatimonadota bacterium]